MWARPPRSQRKMPTPRYACARDVLRERPSSISRNPVRRQHSFRVVSEELAGETSLHNFSRDTRRSRVCGMFLNWARMREGVERADADHPVNEKSIGRLGWMAVFFRCSTVSRSAQHLPPRLYTRLVRVARGSWGTGGTTGKSKSSVGAAVAAVLGCQDMLAYSITF